MSAVDRGLYQCILQRSHGCKKTAKTLTRRRGAHAVWAATDRIFPKVTLSISGICMDKMAPSRISGHPRTR